ncbi:MAG TPA: hypothetical protein VGU25_11005 [Acidobacteriaceae bacterium]|nr:hypothetical protein [Acidobacteriaceae bacterium]
MKSSTALSLVCVAASLIGANIHAQTKASDKLYSARALYYTPTTQGLRSFHCALVIDWKDLLARFSGTDIQEDNPFLKYLQTAHLSVTDDLKSGGQLDWANTAVPPEGKEGPAAKMKEGMQKMITSFFQTWNGYMSGKMVPAPDDSTTVTEVNGTIQLHAKAANMDVTESFDKNMLLTEAHVVTPSIDATAYPTYVDTSDGRVVSIIRTVYRQPPTAPPAEGTFTVSYAMVSNFRLPETLSVNAKNIGAFVFKFSGCSVETAEKAAGKL